MKFLVPNYSCLQNPWLRGYHPQIPVLSVLCPQLNLLNTPLPPKKKNSWVRHWSVVLHAVWAYLNSNLEMRKQAAESITESDAGIRLKWNTITGATLGNMQVKVVILKMCLNEELNSLYSSPNIIQVIKAGWMRRAGNVVCMGEMHTGFW